MSMGKCRSYALNVMFLLVSLSTYDTLVMRLTSGELQEVAPGMDTIAPPSPRHVLPYALPVLVSVMLIPAVALGGSPQYLATTY